MLLALLDGRALPATELARIAHLSAPATSLHLAKLLQAGLVDVRSEGRYRFFIQRPAATSAHALEALGVVATTARAARGVAGEGGASDARNRCYDHLAGCAPSRWPSG